MRKKFWVLLLSAVCSIFFVFVSQAQLPSTNPDPVGIILLRPQRQKQFDPIGSGIYLGRGVILTNWHIATNAALLLLQGVDVKSEDQLLTYQIDRSSNSQINASICLIKPSPNSPSTDGLQYRISPTNTEGCIPYNLTQWQSFRPSQPTPSPLIPTVPLKQLLFLDRNLEVAVVKLDPEELDAIDLSPPCLEIQPVKQGEKLTIKSHAYGRYPAVTVTATVQDDKPMLRTDPDPRVPVKNRYAAMSIVATLPPGQGDLVGPGSSGGPVFNRKGGLVGLVWTGQDLADGTKEVWITPASVWLPMLEQARIPDEDLNKVLDAYCPVKL
ncbi:S1 family peptidase [Argonema antarcticum]|uniref:S1 family peptidase n=1 Tax=Argonema antarcticum TaxID=2942763 RepID=UPI0020110CF8|nr:serine protease [Argonema antarcticum]MCL1473709.1 serine protease [Argonema antarcticum A004/B2]